VVSRDPHALWERELPDGRLVTVDRLTFGRARLHVSRFVGLTYDDGW
jgi:hypothetical protein